MGDEDAFEELCCQLFETWGQHQWRYSEDWTYRNIRGKGGDGGIEAYWHNTKSDDWVGLQAKWFPRSITSTQFSELTRSINAATTVRPTMRRYIVCIPHNLASAKSRGEGKRTYGEEGHWKRYVEKKELEYPGFQIELWDENEIFTQLQHPENEGCWRFWFEHSLVNPETIELSLKKTIGCLESRYIPELTDDGGMSSFLDGFFGTRDTRLALVRKVDSNITLSNRISARIASLVEVDNKAVINMRGDAHTCANTLKELANWLTGLKYSLTAEPESFLDIEPFEVNYSAIDKFYTDVYDAKGEDQLSGHIDELSNLFEEFKAAPSSWEIAHETQRTLSETHCIIKGEQGTGKTCGFANKAREYQQQQLHIPILIPANSVKDHENWWQVIANSIGVGSDWNESALWQALSSQVVLHDFTDGDYRVRSKVAIFVDGLDEKPPFSFWEKMIKEGDAISHRYPRIRFAYSSRPSGANFNKNDHLDSCSYFLDSNGDVPACQLFDSYIQHYQVDLCGNEQLRWLLRTPMELGMFCTIYEGKKVPANVSTCLTELVEQEIERLEEEFTSRNHRNDLPGSAPVRNTLLGLALTFLGSDIDELAEDSLKAELIKVGLDSPASVEMIRLLTSYGILSRRTTKGQSTFDPPINSYAIGARHLWDYFMAVRMLEGDFCMKKELLKQHQDAAEMLSILLVEKKGMLPLDCRDFVAAVSDTDAYEFTLFALSNARPKSVAQFKDWVLDEMRSGANGLSKIVNELVIQVAEVKGHPFGPLLLDEFLRSFDSPAKRDAVWSLPSSMRIRGIRQLAAIYYEREALQYMPQLHKQETSEQMPLVLTWGLSSLSNLKRQHCRNELVKWALLSPDEFAKLFAHFCSIDDPQIREDMFAIAEEVICQGSISKATEKEIGELVLCSLYSESNKLDNRDAALRFYGRILAEKCFSDGIFSDSEIAKCRPPYVIDVASPLPIFPDASKATLMKGYFPIDYDLARYALTDRLASTFGILHFGPYQQEDHTSVSQVILESAVAVGAETPAFDGWVIAAAYQYLLDHGYDPAVFNADASDGENCAMGVDSAVRSYFYPASHGQRSTVMTVAEKYVWCALKVISGYMADRVPIQSEHYEQFNSINDTGLVTNYNTLLSFDSPLFEATVHELSESRVGSDPVFPMPFSCNKSTALLNADALQAWINSAPIEAATTLLDYQPDTGLSIQGESIPIALYANDWGVCGKESRISIYAGIMDRKEVEILEGASNACFDGYVHASDFLVRFSTSACYLSPVEALSAPEAQEYDEPSVVQIVAEAHLNAKPLSGEGVTSLAGMEDYFYDFPSELARALCSVTNTDGCRYYDTEGNTCFEYIKFGTPYRHEYKALLANKSILMDRVSNKGKVLVWYATVERDATNLAKERIPGLDERAAKSWIVWQSDSDSYSSCPVSEKEREIYQRPTDDFLTRILSGIDSIENSKNLEEGN